MVDTTESLNAEAPPYRLSPAWLLVPILLIGAYWRLRLLGEVAYWFDESFCLKMAEFPISEILVRCASDTHPPFYFLLLKFWGAVFGTSPVAARGLSVICGLATIAGTFLFVREAYRPQVSRSTSDRRDELRRSSETALTAAALVALSPFQIEWSLMVRMYAPLATLAVFSAWFLMRALRRPGPRRLDWTSFTITAILLAYTHYFGLFTLAAEFSFAGIYVWRYGATSESRIGAQEPIERVGQAPLGDMNSSSLDLSLRAGPRFTTGCRFSRARPLFISAVVVVTAWSLWVKNFLEQRERVVDNFWSRPLDWDGIGNIFFQIFAVHEWEPAPAFAGLIIAQAAVVGIVLVLSRGRPGDVLVALAASLPFVAVIGISLLGRNILFARYLLSGHLFLLIAGAVLLSRVPFWPLRSCTILLVLGGMSLLSWKHYERRERLAHLPGMQQAIGRFEEARQPGEQLIVCDPMLFTSVWAYSRHRNDCFVNGAEYPFFHGTAVLRDSDYFPRERLDNGTCPPVWTLDANNWLGSNWAVPMPPEWKVVGDWRFPEYYCGELVLRMWERPTDE